MVTMAGYRSIGGWGGVGWGGGMSIKYPKESGTSRTVSTRL